jgi:heptosyltransferase I
VNRILIVRMSALGDIVHALPVLSAIRAAYPAVEVDWLADRKYAGVLDLVDGISRRIIGRPGLPRAAASMRSRRYDVALDLQGLLKSAAMARLSGATRVIGFERPALRERSAAWFYSETVPVAAGVHVIQKNLSVLPALGITPAPEVRFPFVVPSSAVADQIASASMARGTGFALINPGAAWPNKRWAPERFGAVAARMRGRHSLSSYVLWGRGEDALADAVVAASDGAAERAPDTSLGDLLALSSRASLLLSGDTGPLHLAAAMATPIVGLYGPTWPERNGPWSKDDEVVSRASVCECHHKRRCQRAGNGPVESRMCINDISVEQVAAAVDARLARAARTR